MTAATRRVMLIRHAEEPDPDTGDLGVDERGCPDADALSVRGWQRAGALVRLFVPRKGFGAVPHLAVPAALFAANDPGKSSRPLCTLQPLGRLLGLPVDTRFGSENDVAPLLAALGTCQGPVLLAWRHRSIASLAQALAGPGRAPERWEAGRYDLVWVFEQRGGAWHFINVPQRLLPGDG